MGSNARDNLVAGAGAFVASNLFVNKTGAKASMGEPRGKFCRVVPAKHAVTSVEIVGNEVLIPKVILRAGMWASIHK